MCLNVCLKVSRYVGLCLLAAAGFAIGTAGPEVRDGPAARPKEP